jgi:cobalt-zinc-cadmium efflux system protein
VGPHSVHRLGHGAHAHREAAQPDRAFALGLGLNVAFVLVEAGFGFYADSLALLADAGHNLSDVLGLALAWGAAALARRPPGGRFTYGLRGSTIWAALANAMMLLVAVGAIAWEALHRFAAPQTVAAGVVIAVALAGVAVNGASALLFLRGAQRDLNVRGAFLHMAADAAISLGVAVAGAAILWTGWQWLDPAISLLIAAAIVAGTWGLLRESLALTLHSVPQGLDLGAVRAHLAALSGVASLHDLHVWAMSTTETALTVHLVMPDGHPGDAFLERAAHGLAQRFGIGHATLQIEHGDGSARCRLEPDEVV